MLFALVLFDQPAHPDAVCVIHEEDLVGKNGSRRFNGSYGHKEMIGSFLFQFYCH